MDSSNITPEQGRQLHERIAPMLKYIGELKKRLEERHFPVDDRLYRDTLATYNGLRDLFMTTHYLGVGTGVCLPRKHKPFPEVHPDDRI